MAAAIGWSRFETLKAMDLTKTQLREGIYVLLRQGSGQLHDVEPAHENAR